MYPRDIEQLSEIKKRHAARLPSADESFQNYIDIDYLIALVEFLSSQIKMGQGSMSDNNRRHPLLEDGYQPLRKGGYQPTQTASENPQPPKGGTAAMRPTQSSPQSPAPVAAAKTSRNTNGS